MRTSPTSFSSVTEVQHVQYPRDRSEGQLPLLTRKPTTPSFGTTKRVFLVVVAIIIFIVLLNLETMVERMTQRQRQTERDTETQT